MSGNGLKNKKEEMIECISS